jgi:molybdopterin synthase sulfur carrier subunit
MPDKAVRPVKILYFAWLREKIGSAAEEVALPPEITTVSALVAWLRGRGPGYEAAFCNASLVRCALDQEFAGPDALIAAAREIAFFPPVTGG